MSVVIIMNDEDSMSGETPGADEAPLGEEVGNVFKYFAKVEVAAINITRGSLKVGDTIRIKGATTDFTQQIESMEIERQSVDSAGVGDSIGVKVKDRVRENDIVYKL